MKPTFEQFTHFLARNLFINPAQIKPNKTLRNDLGLNSIEFLELVVHLENAYHISLPDLELERVRTVQDLSNLMDKHV